MNNVLRYLNIEKLEWLLSDKGIYIGSASSQSDPEEAIYDHRISKLLKSDMMAFKSDDWEKIDDLSYGLMINKQKNLYLSSWYRGDNESVQMWNEYGKDGVAIISDELSLISTLPEPLEQVLTCYHVVYDDQKKIGAINDPLKYKSAKFTHENEFRLVFDMQSYALMTGYEKEKYPMALIEDIPSYEHKSIIGGISEQGYKQSHDVIYSKSNGYVIKYDLNQVIHEIKLNPTCSAHQEQYIRKICEKAGLQCSIQYSTLK